jgi:hypothetical protein
LQLDNQRGGDGGVPSALLGAATVGGDFTTAFFVASLACGDLVMIVFKADSAGDDFAAAFFVAVLEGGFSVHSVSSGGAPF